MHAWDAHNSLQNALKVKERELDELKREMGAQRALVVAKDRYGSCGALFNPRPLR